MESADRKTSCFRTQWIGQKPICFIGSTGEKGRLFAHSCDQRAFNACTTISHRLTDRWTVTEVCDDDAPPASHTRANQAHDASHCRARHGMAMCGQSSPASEMASLTEHRLNWKGRWMLGEEESQWEETGDPMTGRRGSANASDERDKWGRGWVSRPCSHSPVTCKSRDEGKRVGRDCGERQVNQVCAKIGMEVTSQPDSKPRKSVHEKDLRMCRHCRRSED